MFLNVVFSLFVSFGAYANPINFEGNFVEPTYIHVGRYDSRVSCEENGGEWMTDSPHEACYFLTENSAVVSRKSNGVIELTLSIIGHNTNICYFTSESSQVKSENSIVFSAVSENWDSVREEFTLENCEVTLVYSENGNAIRAFNNDKCSAFCSAGVDLELTNAERKSGVEQSKGTVLKSDSIN